MEAAIQAKVDVSAAKNAVKVDAESKIVATRRQGEGNKEEIKVKTEVQILFKYETKVINFTSLLIF